MDNQTKQMTPAARENRLLELAEEVSALLGQEIQVTRALGQGARGYQIARVAPDGVVRALAGPIDQRAVEGRMEGMVMALEIVRREQSDEAKALQEPS